MALALYHLNPDTERIGRCRAENGRCPFGSDNPHFTTREETQAYYENELEAEYGLFGSSKELSLDRTAVARRLNLLPAEAMDQLIRERWRRGGYTPREAEQMLAKGEAFYVHYTTNQEITLDPESRETRRTFMRGACGRFAEQIHRATGWPLAVFSSNEFPGLWQGHVAAKLPDGRFLDVTGASDNPLREFGPDAEGWTVTEASNLEELHEQTANRNDGKLVEKSQLPLLERFAVARIAYDVLDGEGLLAP